MGRHGPDQGHSPPGGSAPPDSDKPGRPAGLADPRRVSGRTWRTRDDPRRLHAIAATRIRRDSESAGPGGPAAIQWRTRDDPRRLHAVATKPRLAPPHRFGETPRLPGQADPRRLHAVAARPPRRFGPFGRICASAITSAIPCRAGPCRADQLRPPVAVRSLPREPLNGAGRLRKPVAGSSVRCLGSIPGLQRECRREMFLLDRPLILCCASRFARLGDSAAAAGGGQRRP